MKKTAALCICLSCLSLFAPAAATEFRWADVYRSGPVKLSPDPVFGKGVDWGSFLFEAFRDIAVADDGTIFMVNGREHTIHKFDPSGRKVLTFSQKGQGPGDVMNPDHPSLLDDRYLVVGEYASNRRISLFDLDGHFVRVLKTERPVFGVVALTGTKIAYLARQHEAGAGGPTQGIASVPTTIRVVLKDIETGVEQVLLSRASRAKFIMHDRLGATSLGGDNEGTVFLTRTGDGCLAVGIGNSPEIEIYDTEGRRVRSFALEKSPQPATPDFIARYKKDVIASLKKQFEKMPPLLSALPEIERLDFSLCFDEPLRIFTDLMTDADGNFLFFLRPENPDEPGLDFAAYSPQGRLIAETRLDPGPFEVDIDYRFRRLCFAKGGLICLAPLKDDEDELPVLFRVVPAAAK